MHIIINNSSMQPIYEQIVTQLRRRILSGELSPGEMLPSIRALAKDLRISVITTKRAYEELEREGFIENFGTVCSGKDNNTGIGPKAIHLGKELI